MLSSRYLASCSDELVELYSQLENDIITDMAKRICKMGMTPSSEWQAQILKDMGGIQKDVNAYLNKYNKKAQELIKSTVTDALQKADDKDKSLVNSAKREMMASQRQILETMASKTQGTAIVTGSQKVEEDAVTGGVIKVFSGIQRLTQTIASTAQSDFVNAANRAYMQVNTGAFSYDYAIRNAVTDLASKGVDTVEYTDSGRVIHRTIESAVRSNVMTGVNQQASAQTLANCESTGTDLVEVSAHMGARDRDVAGRPWANHAEWQGKVYSLSGKRTYIDGDGNTKTAEDFYEVCHPGEPDGICGINCRHSYYPYFEGTSLEYSKGELNEYKDKRVTYNGIEMTQYEAEQKLRQMERSIRKYKRVANAQQAGGIDNSVATAKVKEWQSYARSLCSQTGIKRHYTNEFVGKFSKEALTVSGKTPINSVFDYKEIKGNHSTVEDNKTVNPNYKTIQNNPSIFTQEEKFKYTHNCQRCVPTWELRRRGKDVVAQGCNATNVSELLNDKFANYGKNGFASMYEKPKIKYSFTPSAVQKEILSWGNGARAEIAYLYNDSIKGHVVAAEVVNNKVYYLDPQTGNKSENIHDIVKNYMPNTIKFFRTDNLIFNNNMLNCSQNRRD